MLKENWRLISRIERIGDCVLVIVAFFLSYYGRDSLVFWDYLLGLGLPFTGLELAPMKDYFIVLVMGLFGYVLSLNLLRAYGSMRLRSIWELFRISIAASLLVFFILAAFLFVLKINLSRSFIGLFCLIVCLSLALERVLVLKFLRFWRRRGVNYRNIIIAGTGPQSLKLARAIAGRTELGVRIRAFADLAGRPAANQEDAEFQRLVKKQTKMRAVRIIRGVGGIERVLRKYSVDEVIFTDVLDVMPRVQEVVNICSEQGIETTIAADIFSLGIVNSGISYFGGMPLIHFQTPPGDRWELSVKRTCDIVIAALVLILLSPVFLLVSALIFLTMGRPIVFKQKRMGLNGRLFEMYKFRSMRRGAESEIEELAEMNEMNGPVFKLTDDPRITPFGRFLRRYSVDELPQLWNVIRGDMSLVGPRPPLPGEVSLYERKDRRRLSMRPGMTCTWQVSGRNLIPDFEEWVRMDLEYIDNWSLLVDLVILFKTVPAVIIGDGAK